MRYELVDSTCMCPAFLSMICLVYFHGHRLGSVFEHCVVDARLSI